MNILAQYPREINIFPNMSGDINRYITQFAWGRFRCCDTCHQWRTDLYFEDPWETHDTCVECRHNLKSKWQAFCLSRCGFMVQYTDVPFAVAREHIALPHYFDTYFVQHGIRLSRRELMESYSRALLDFSTLHRLHNRIIPRHLVTPQELLQPVGINLFGIYNVTKFIKGMPNVLNRKILDMAWGTWFRCYVCDELLRDEWQAHECLDNCECDYICKGCATDWEEEWDWWIGFADTYTGMPWQYLRTKGIYLSDDLFWAADSCAPDDEKILDYIEDILNFSEAMELQRWMPIKKLVRLYKDLRTEWWLRISRHCRY